MFRTSLSPSASDRAPLGWIHLDRRGRRGQSPTDGQQQANSELFDRRGGVTGYLGTNCGVTLRETDT